MVGILAWMIFVIYDLKYVHPDDISLKQMIKTMALMILFWPWIVPFLIRDHFS